MSQGKLRIPFSILIEASLQSLEFDPRDFQAGHKEHKEHKEGFMERIFGHHPRHDDNKASAENESQEQEQDQTTKERESSMDDFRDYLGKDKQLEEEGKTYGGLI